MADNYLEHYGVLGMKWGVRKDKQKAYDKSMTKLKKLNKKATKKDMKSAKMAMKAAKKEEKAYRTARKDKAYKLNRKALKYKRKSTKAAFKSKKYIQKAKTWVDHMNDTFAGITIDSISTDDIAIGKQYSVQILEDFLNDNDWDDDDDY